MNQRTVMWVTVALLVALAVGVWRFKRGGAELGLAPEAGDQVIVDFTLSHLKSVGPEAVQRCGALVANQELDATVKVATVAGGIEVEDVSVTKSSLEPELRKCVAKAFTGTRQLREGRFKDRIPAGREYELDMHLALPAASAGYGQ